ncbi:class II fructose-bisphosphate aldolase [candidate division KSB1 bacterium]|nr:class II fructose-bisphosphate aldolase [candidate division KSB1 bacterium]
MALVNMVRMLHYARKEGYAVGAFNILDYNSFKAVVVAAEELEAPVIVQTSVKTVVFWGYEVIFNWYLDIAEPVGVPVAMHLDHCKDPDIIKKCIDAGWTSVMIDASSEPFEENMAVTRQVLEMAQPAGVSVEAELGEIGGVEDDIAVDEENAFLADPEKALYFCRKLPVDCFAPAIGTAHGLYKGEPKIAFDNLERIAAGTSIPLALHGGTGLSDDVFKRCIALGCAKVNISTQLKYSFIDAFVRYFQQNSKEYNPLKVLDAQFKDMKKMVQEKIRLFGSAGKAW